MPKNIRNHGRSSARAWWMWSVLLLAIAVTYFITQPQPLRQERITYPAQPVPRIVLPSPIPIPEKTSEQKIKEGAQIFERLMGESDPFFIGNKYYPPFGIAWLRGIVEANKKGELLITPVTTFPGASSTLMASGYNGQKMEIEISLLKLWGFVNVDYPVTKYDSRVAKHTFMNGMVHEALHLRGQKKEFFDFSENSTDTQRVYEERLKEELRVWPIMIINVIRPLRVVGQPLNNDDIEADGILRGCKDDPSCPLFVEFIKKRFRDPYQK